MTIDRYELEKIANYYEGLNKEAAAPLVTAAIRLAPTAFKFLSKAKFLRPFLAKGLRGLRSAGRFIGSKGALGKGFVQGFRGADIGKAGVRQAAKWAANNASVAQHGALGINQAAAKKLMMGRKLGHFVNVNTWSPYNKGFMVDAPLFAAGMDMMLGGKNPSDTQQTTYNYDPDYEDYLYGRNA